MSNYTTELRFVCESLAGRESGYNGIAEIIEKARPKIFSFEYPIFDPNYKKALESKIIRHFYTREICEETVGLWKLRLEDKLNCIMPYYNQLYKSELLKFNPFYDIDYTMTHKGRANESKKQKQTQDVKGNTDFTEGIDTKSHTDSVDNIVDNTHTLENEINQTIGNEKTDFVDDKTLDEKTNTVTDTTDDKTTNVVETTDKTLTKDVELNDTEKTTEHVTEKWTKNEERNQTENKTVNDIGNNVDTTVIDEITVRTPDLTNNTKTDNITDDTGTGSDLRTVNRSEDTTTKQTDTGTQSTKGTKNYSEKTLDLYSDTPQGNIYQPLDPTTGEPIPDDGMSLEERLKTRYLTNARNVSHDYAETNSQNTETTTQSDKTTDFDEKTQDDITHNRNYKTTLDGTIIETNTGNETTDKDGNNVLTKKIDETHTTKDDINETTDTDYSGTKDTTKDFTKNQTEHTDQKEHIDFTSDKTENERIHTNTDFTRNQTENEQSNKNVDSKEDYTGNIDTNEDYTRSRGTSTDSTGNKDTTSNKNFVENLIGDLHHNIRNTDEYINHAIGKISDTSYSKLLIEFRETFLNIDMMILDELNDLFFMLY